MISLAEQIADAVADRLRCDPLFWESPAVEVRSLQRHEELSEMNVAFIKATIGAFVAVYEMPVPAGNRRSPNLFANIKVDVMIVDNRTLNKSGKSAELLAEAAAAALGSYQPALCEELLRVESIEEASTGDDVDTNRRVLRLRCNAAAVNPHQPGETAAPTIVMGGIGGLVATVDGPDGATVRYTLDGTRPTTMSPVYISPLGLDSGQTLTVRAWKSGERASLVTTATAP